jgi:uncharacterized protein YukE
VSAEDTEGLPWPEGDPGVVRGAAQRASGLASQLQGLHGGVAATHAAGWSGAAAAAFAGAVRSDAAAVALAAEAFHTAAGALNDLATALEHARERVRRAARKLREAREHAAAAQRRATQARADADAAHQAAALNPATGLGDPLGLQAQTAEGEARQAESAAATAQGELARVQAWAEREAEDACQDARTADHRCAGLLDGAAAGPLSLTTGMPLAGAIGPAGQLGSYLMADAYNFWSGGKNDGNFPYGSGAKALLSMNGIRKWMPEYGAYRSWVNAAGTGDGTLTAAMKAEMLDALPTFNNGMIGKGLAKGLSRLPATEGAGKWLSTASKATPVFRYLGIAGGVASTGIDAYGLIKQGNPVTAFKRDGAGYVADVGKTAFSASSTAFLIAPNPVTGTAVVVSGAVWLGAEGWEHREQIGHAISQGADYVWDHSLVGEAWNHRADIGNALDKGVDTVGSGLSTAEHLGGEALDKGKDLLDKIPTPW